MLLVVEDDESIQHLTQLVLQAAGFEVMSAHDGQQGIALFRQHASSIEGILLDLSMPNLSGIDTLNLLREHSPAIPVLIMSGFSDRDVPEEHRLNPATAFLQKPFTLAALREALKALLKRE